MTMSKSILVINTPNCCYECFALDEYGDYPICRITGEQRGYTFRTREQKMDKCPLKSPPEEKVVQPDYRCDWELGYNSCLHDVLGGKQ